MNATPLYHITLTERELTVLYAGFFWNRSLDMIDCTDAEFDAMVARLGELLPVEVLQSTDPVS